MPTPTTYYTPCSPIIIGCRLYTNLSMSTAVPNGYYSDGFNVYQVTGGTGLVTNITVCPPPPTTAAPCQGDCCFIGNTMISLPEGGIKKIEDIQQNDIVLTFNEATQKVEENKVLSIRSRQSSDLVRYSFANGVVITSTSDHPYYVNGYTIASYNPLVTTDRYGFEIDVDQINIGDTVNLANGDTTYIEDIEALFDKERVYTLEIDNNHNYYANGILVHNKTVGSLCCYNSVTGQYSSITNAGDPNHPGCCCLGPNWVIATDPAFCGQGGGI